MFRCSVGGVGSRDGVHLLRSLLFSLLMLDGISWVLSGDWSVSSLLDSLGSFGESPSASK